LVERQERLAFIDQVEIDVKQILALRRHHDYMVGPQFIEQGAMAAHRSISALRTA